MGAKHQPSYRIVITPALTPRDGSYLDQVGFYNPVTEPMTLRIDNAKAIAWLRKGAQPTDRVVRLLKSVDIIPEDVRKPTATGQDQTAAVGSTSVAVEESAASEVADEKPKRSRRKVASEDQPAE